MPREQYKALANVYGSVNQPYGESGGKEKRQPFLVGLPKRSKDEDENKKREHFRLAPRLALTPEEEDRPPHTPRQILEGIDFSHTRQLRRLKDLLARKPSAVSTERIWRTYDDLPTPRLRYLSDRHVLKLLRHLTWVEKRSMESSERYFALLDEALNEGVPLGADQWNGAIAFAGRMVQGTTSEDVKAAIETWLRMEREGGVSADHVTFNILFDVAVKAGRFALADTIYAEMDRRKLELNRYFRTSKIYYAGNRGDGESVRAAFRELVAAGEIVDTAIMNCVIVSLVRCGETASAEHIMEKMKLLHEQKFGAAALADWREKKEMGRQLEKSAKELREDRQRHLESFFGTPYMDDDKKEAIQRAAPIAPDELTYRILIQWHANVSGNLDKIRKYLIEIAQQGFRVHHNVFFNLFNGFRKHGGYAFTAWNRKGLESFWSEYLATIAGDAAAAAIAARVEARMKNDPFPVVERYEVYPLDPSDAETSYNESLGEDRLDEGGPEENDPEYTDPLPSHLAPMEFRPGTVLAALAAFYKCAGLKRMLEVWEEVQEAWTDMGEADKRRIEDLIVEKRREASVYAERER